MPQGNFKGKNKGKDLGKGVQPKANQKMAKPKTSQKKNRPIQPKKAKHEEVARLKKIITKNVNKAIEEQIRSIASDQKVHLSKKKDKTVSSDPNKMPPKQ